MSASLQAFALVPPTCPRIDALWNHALLGIPPMSDRRVALSVVRAAERQARERLRAALVEVILATGYGGSVFPCAGCREGCAECRGESP